MGYVCQTLKLIGSGQGTLAASPRASQVPRLPGFLGMGWIMPKAKVPVGQRRLTTGLSMLVSGGASPDHGFNTSPSITKDNHWLSRGLVIITIKP